MGRWKRSEAAQGFGSLDAGAPGANPGGDPGPPPGDALVGRARRGAARQAHGGPRRAYPLRAPFRQAVPGRRA
eukprot:5364235-Alexandrium_andersonii.AAC.1